MILLKKYRGRRLMTALRAAQGTTPNVVNHLLVRQIGHAARLMSAIWRGLMTRRRVLASLADEARPMAHLDSSDWRALIVDERPSA